MPIINLLAQFDTPTENQFCQMSLTNMFLTTGQPRGDGSNPTYLAPSPGLASWVDLSGNSIRGMLSHNNILHVVKDNTYYTITEAGLATSRGTIGTSSGPVSMVANLTQLMLTDGSLAYYVNLTTFTITQITDVDFPAIAPNRLTYLNGYAAFTTEAENAVHIMDLNDFSSYTATNYTQLDDTSTKVNGCQANNGELWVFTRDRCSVWTNTGATPFPFEKRTNTLLSYGNDAELSIVNYDNSIVWLGTNEAGDKAIYQSIGYGAKRVSGEALTTAIQSYETTSDAIAFLFSIRGHSFYQICFPTEGVTWRLDLRTGFAHKVTSRDSFGVFRRHIANAYAFFNNKHYVGDYLSGNIYEMSTDFFDEAGSLMEREVVTHVIQDELDRFPVSRVRIDMQVGTGLTSGQGSNPQVMLAYSKDGGKTYGAEMWRSAGKIGEYSKLVEWNRLGVSRKRTFKVRYTDPTQISFFKFFLEF